MYIHEKSYPILINNQAKNKLLEIPSSVFGNSESKIYAIETLLSVPI